MQLNNNGDRNSKILPIFDCSWISRFNGEEEKLFMGGLYRIRIESIINIENRKNFAAYFRPLYYFDCMLSGSEMTDIVATKKRDVKIMKWLISKNDKVEEYVQKSFEAFCQQKSQIIINLLYTKNLALFAELLYDINDENLVVFNQSIFFI